MADMDEEKAGVGKVGKEEVTEEAKAAATAMAVTARCSPRRLGPFGFQARNCAA